MCNINNKHGTEETGYDFFLIRVCTCNMPVNAIVSFYGFSAKMTKLRDPQYNARNYAVQVKLN